VDLREPLAARTEALWDYVWLRRLAYLLSTPVVLSLVLLALSNEVWIAPDFLSDGRNWVGGIIGLAAAMLPSPIDSWTESYQVNPFWTLLLLFALLALNRLSKRTQLRLRDDARAMWREATAVGAPMPAPSRRSDRPAVSGLQKLRNSFAIQRTAQIIRWHVLPSFLGVLLLITSTIAALWLFAGLTTQLLLPSLERGNTFCQMPPTATHLPDGATLQNVRFQTRATCISPNLWVKKGERYRITFNPTDAWFDGSHPAPISGLEAGDHLFPVGYLGVPFRRVVAANYLQPVVEIRRRKEEAEWFGEVYMYSLSLQFNVNTGDHRAEFEATQDGALLLFANDSIVPLVFNNWHRYFYLKSGDPPPHKSEAGNHGEALVTIQRLR
jgi:hypothetical protein